MGNIMRRVGGDGKIAAGELVFALRAGLDAPKPVCQRDIDRLMVVDLEMQEGMTLDAAPVAAVERIGADAVDGAGDIASVALRPHRTGVFCDALAENLLDGR